MDDHGLVKGGPYARLRTNTGNPEPIGRRGGNEYITKNQSRQYHRQNDVSDGRGGSNLFGAAGGIKYADIMLFIITGLLAVLVIVILLLAFVVSSHHGSVMHLVSRVETVGDLARNFNDASQVMRRALGEYASDDGARGVSGKHPTGGGAAGDTKKGKKSGGQNLIASLLKKRGPADEAAITDNAARTLAKGIQTLVRILDQTEQSGLMATVATTATRAGEMLARPELNHILHAVDSVVQHPQANVVVSQTADLVAHLESALLPVFDALAAELGQKLRELMEAASDDGQAFLSGPAFQAMVKQMVDVIHKTSTGMRDLVVWFRAGGPAEAVILASDVIATSRDLLESPAAKSLVAVLEGIDWTVTGSHIGDAAHNVAQIIRTINQADTVDAGDRLIRAVAGVMEDPGTQRAVAMLPGIAAEMTALLARDSTQALISQGTLLMGRVDQVLDKAEQSRTVERTATFLGTLDTLLGSLTDGGVHIELGQPTPVSTEAATPAQTSTAQRGVSSMSAKIKPKPEPEPEPELSPKPDKTIMSAAEHLIATGAHGVPRIIGAVPEKGRGNTGPQNQRRVNKMRSKRRQGAADKRNAKPGK